MGTSFGQKLRHPLCYDVTVKYTDEPKERITWTVGRESNASIEDLFSMFDNPNLEYLRIELSPYWRARRDEGLLSG